MAFSQTPKILIVEDDPPSLELLASYFHKENFDVVKAGNSHEAELALENNNIDIILSTYVVLPLA